MTTPAPEPAHVRTILRPGPVVTREDWPTAPVRSIHVVRIGGAGMSAVARLALEVGIAVSGSDSQDGQFIAPLREAGARIGIGFDASLLADDVDVVVVSTAVRADNPEVAAAHDRQIPVVHRAAALAGLLAGRELIAVAGTHGKTSTTAMATVALRGGGDDPAWALGAAVPALGRNAGHGSGHVAVVEADESDGSFLAFAPRAIVVTNLEPDHLDFHGTPENLTAAFDAFTERLVPGGVLVVCGDDAGARALGERAAARGTTVQRYGTGDDEPWRLAVETPTAHGTEVVYATPRGEVAATLAVHGHHNVLNALGALAASHAALPAAPVQSLLTGIAPFTGASRRFEKKGTVGGVTVYDDYAHHASEVAATLAAARGIAGAGRVIAVFQPHLFSRTRSFAADFAHALGAADQAFVLPVYAAREDDDPETTARTITDRAAPGTSVVPLDDREQAPALVAEAARPGDVVLMLGAGDIVEDTPRVLDALRAAGAQA
ncbi:UDP-N-acetylmuramate--L-alanine ligase [Brachybacterium huguangmaarense]|uniref:UDP-N-acetylmuramate--L-alanine ligase n=1 Tax=Brachybacterium huguangmaarense TaxID=1652028 RepID=A0ABY6FYS0_9MICO|nr:UDP-N-acetylmuramate--L-alanine ligase [Brachybacterium huguangmaarense]UYG15568.1 UDP-N-acetylmuramate--L-alanine ligase [Brachybacterium huguangmaarense]